MSNPRLNQDGPLSGFLLFTKINCTLAQLGQAQVDAPLAQPQFPALAVVTLMSPGRGRHEARRGLPGARLLKHQVLNRKEQTLKLAPMKLALCNGIFQG